MKVNVRLFSLLLAFGAASAPVFATSYTFETITFPGAISTATTGINDAGQIIGTYTDSSGTHGFLDSNGSFQKLMYGGTDVLPISINNAGQYVASSASGYLLYSNHSFTSINSVPYTGPGAPQQNVPLVSVVGINNNGQILANSYGGIFGLTGQAFLIVSSGLNSYTVVGGGDHSFATGFNDNGQLISYYGGASGNQGFGPNGQILTPAQINVSVNPTGLNNSGEVVGTYATPFTTADVDNGFINIGGVSTTFDFPDAYVTELSGINNVGDIVGSYGPSSLSQNTTSGFVAIASQPASAVPEPGAVPLVILGLGCLAVRRQRLYVKR